MPMQLKSLWKDKQVTNGIDYSNHYQFYQTKVLKKTKQELTDRIKIIDRIINSRQETLYEDY